MSFFPKLLFGLAFLPAQALAMDVEHPGPAAPPPAERVIVVAPPPVRVVPTRATVGAVPPADRVRCAMPFTGGRAIPAPADAGTCVWLVQVPGATSATLSLDALTAVPPQVERIRVLRADGAVLAELTGALARGTSVTGLPSTFIVRVDAEPQVARTLRAHVVAE